MLRIVFQDAEFYRWYNSAHQLSDLFIEYVEKFSAHLKILAFSVTENMNSEVICKLLKNSNIETLDLHCTQDDGSEIEGEVNDFSAFGLISDEFLRPILFSLNKVKTLNFFGQNLITEGLFIDFLNNPEACELIESLCVNCIPLSSKFLASLIQPHINIKRLSIVDCDIPDNEIIDWLDQLETGGLSRKKLKSIHCSPHITHQAAAVSDGW